jgi:hypothetical protein
MRRILLGIALGLGSIAVMAGPPSPPTVSVEVTNTPLRVTTTQATVPFDKFGANIKSFPCNMQRTTNYTDQWEEMGTCTDDVAATFDSPILVWNVIFSSEASSYPSDENARWASCWGMYYLSVDDGATFKRIGQVTWSPGQHQSVVEPFPVPIEIPAGSAIRQQFQVRMKGGKVGDGCFAIARLIYSNK